MCHAFTFSTFIASIYEWLSAREYRGQRDEDRGTVEEEEETVENLGDDPPLFGYARRGVLVRQPLHVRRQHRADVDQVGASRRADVQDDGRRPGVVGRRRRCGPSRPTSGPGVVTTAVSDRVALRPLK